MPDWNVLTIDAIHDSGCVKLREYCRNAWMSPMVIAPLATRIPPSTAIATKLRLPTNIVARLDHAGDELRSEAGVVQVVVGCRGTTSSTSRWRPNPLTMAWPVKVSSTWALSLPVCLHCAVNRVRERFAIALIMNIDNGIVTTATSESSHEIQIIMRDGADQRQHLRQHLGQRLLEALRDVVDVVRHAAEQVAALRPVDVAERQTG